MPSSSPASTSASSASSTGSIAPADPHAKRERRKQARPGELLAAALDLFVEKGFAATRVEEVATRAGVSKGTLFLYFPSKEELFKAVIRENLSGRFAHWEMESQTFEGSTADLLRECMNAWWRRIGNTKASGISKLIVAEAHNFPEIAAFYQAEVAQPGARLLQRILQRGIDRGEFRPVPTDYAVFSLIAAMMFLMMWKQSLSACLGTEHPLDPQSYIDSQLDIILNGLRSPSASPRPCAP